jgi:hypothetical protein
MGFTFHSFSFRTFQFNCIFREIIDGLRQRLQTVPTAYFDHLSDIKEQNFILYFTISEKKNWQQSSTSPKKD